ncbi:MAG: hypothetical protein Q8R47_06780 [Nanoarchaeota archaeon]|nr:hypothetical protein [Nanoarchaeota archaeon]
MDVKSLLLKWKGDIDQESIDVYKFLQQSFPTKVDENVFNFVYRSFYRLDNAGLSDKWKLKYFVLLKNKETSLPIILKILYDIKRLKGDHSYQFSFATKLIHTINNDAPIYDSLVDGIFEFRKPKNNKNTINWCIKTYDLLKKEYTSLLQDDQVQQCIKKFKKKYSAQTISDTKALDFILWSIGKELKLKDKNEKN